MAEIQCLKNNFKHTTHMLRFVLLVNWLTGLKQTSSVRSKTYTVLGVLIKTNVKFSESLRRSQGSPGQKSDRRAWLTLQKSCLWLQITFGGVVIACGPAYLPSFISCCSWVFIWKEPSHSLYLGCSASMLWLFSQLPITMPRFFTVLVWCFFEWFPLPSVWKI